MACRFDSTLLDGTNVTSAVDGVPLLVCVQERAFDRGAGERQGASDVHRQDRHGAGQSAVHLCRYMPPFLGASHVHRGGAATGQVKSEFQI
jgi:hypothetical protein